MKTKAIILLTGLALSRVAVASDAGTNFFATARTQSYTNGQKELEVRIDTPGNGRVIRWRQDGSTNSVHEFRNYAYDGTLQTWDKEGHLISAERWRHGERHGVSTFWLSDGRKRLEEEWKEGKCVSKCWWDASGKKHEGDPPVE